MTAQEISINRFRNRRHEARIYISEGYYTETDIARLLRQAHECNHVTPYAVNAGEEEPEA